MCTGAIFISKHCCCCHFLLRHPRTGGYVTSDLFCAEAIKAEGFKGPLFHPSSRWVESLAWGELLYQSAWRSITWGVEAPGNQLLFGTDNQSHTCWRRRWFGSNLLEEALTCRSKIGPSTLVRVEWPLLEAQLLLERAGSFRGWRHQTWRLTSPWCPSEAPGWTRHHAAICFCSPFMVLLLLLRSVSSNGFTAYFTPSYHSHSWVWEEGPVCDWLLKVPSGRPGDFKNTSQMLTANSGIMSFTHRSSPDHFVLEHKKCFQYLNGTFKITFTLSSCSESVQKTTVNNVWNNF